MKEISALVVDDTMTNRKITQAQLKKIGVKSQAVTNGSEAVELHCNGQHFDLIIMDRDMPIMNGVEVHNCIIIGYEIIIRFTYVYVLH